MIIAIARYLFAALVVLLAALFEPPQWAVEIAEQLEDMGWFGGGEA